MRIISAVREMQNLSNQIRLEGKTIGFVPTMGFLHEGHLSLVRESKSKADVTVVSIFVNPTQFSPNEDLDKYPRNYERDEKLLKDSEVDILFYPSSEDIYPENYLTYINVENITSVLEGEFRPTHFKGVSTIVSMLFNIVKPHIAVFGQKDAQQAAVINKMVSDLKYDIKIIISPIIRETDGLAMSSRNVYLSPAERDDALFLFRSLNYCKEMIEKGEKDFLRIKNDLETNIKMPDTALLDYIHLVKLPEFKVVDKLDWGEDYFILIACKIGKTRLIDNILIKT